MQPAQNDLQQATVKPTQIKGDNMPSRTSPLAVGMNMFDTTATLPTKASVVSGREQSDDEDGLDHFGIGQESKCLLDCADERKFNADVKMDVMDAHLSGEKVYGNINDPSCSTAERNQHPGVKNEDYRKVVKDSKTILPIDEDNCTFDLTPKNQKILNIGLDENFIDRDVLDQQISSVLEHPGDKEELCYCGAVTELEYVDACKDRSFLVAITATTEEVSNIL